MMRCLWIGKPTALNAMGNFLVGFIGIAAWQYSTTTLRPKDGFGCLEIRIIRIRIR